MNPLILSAIIFVLMLGGIIVGALLRGALPQHHLSKDSQDTVRLGVGLIATMSALVVGLLIAAAKTSYDTQSGQIKQITADVILLDDLLAQYGPEAQPIREQMRAVIPAFADRIWREKEKKAVAPYETNADAERVYLAIQALSPESNLQRSLQARAVQISTDLIQVRLLLFTETGASIPLPFLGVLAFWLIIIFASFSLFSDLNPTVFVALSVFALSAACAIFLIVELSEPFAGIMMISSTPLRDALAPLGH
jgi:hypothetical protein